MPQRSIRFSDKLAKEIAAVSRDRGFSSETAFIRYAVNQEVSVRQEDLVGAEERLAASIEQARKETFRLRREHQALFAYVDTLAKTLLTWSAGTTQRCEAAGHRTGSGPSSPPPQDRRPVDGRRFAVGNARPYRVFWGRSTRED